MLGESAMIARDRATEPDAGINEILSKEPTPDNTTCFADAFDHLIDKLRDSTLKTIAIRKLNGHTSEEISADLGMAKRTVDRRLELIRAIWTEAAR